MIINISRKDGRINFRVYVDGVEYWGNYTPATFDFYLNSEDGVLGYTEGNRVVGNWTYDEVRQLALTGKLPYGF